MADFVGFKALATTPGAGRRKWIMQKPSIFARLFRPSAKGLADYDADLLALFGVQVSASGVTVSAETALQVPAVSAAVRLIAEAAASLPLRVKIVAADGKETDAPDQSAADLLNGYPNDWQSGYEFRRDMIVEALTEDRGGLAWANRVGGRVVELIRYRPGYVTVDYHHATGEPSYRLDNSPVPASDMLHLRPVFGRAPLSVAREAISVAIMLATHASNLFGKGARPGGALMFPKGIGQEAVLKMRLAWRTTHESGDSARTAILYDGAEYKPHAFTSTDAQFIENRNFQILEIARCFRVPPSMLYQLDRATWGNTEQMGREFLTYTLEPWLQAFEGALRRVFGVTLRFDRDDMTRADLVTRATAINSLIASEVLNPNEGRDWLGLPPREGGEVYGNRNINPDQGGRPSKEEKPNGA